MYAISTLPLIQRLNQSVQQVWYADDATAGGELYSLRHWWNMLREIGPMYGYFVNPTKTWLIVKEEHMTSATDLFLNEGIRITREGRRHLGAALGSRSFTEEYVTSKVAEWTKEVEKLTTIAACQPHAASHTVLVGNGLTLPEQSQELITYSNHWKKSFDTDLYPH